MGNVLELIERKMLAARKLNCDLSVTGINHAVKLIAAVTALDDKIGAAPGL